MSLLRRVRGWFSSKPVDAEQVATTKHAEDDKLTLRASQQGGGQPIVVPTTPDVLDPEREQRSER
jgi:hypothetical protein